MIRHRPRATVLLGVTMLCAVDTLPLIVLPPAVLSPAVLLASAQSPAAQISDPDRRFARLRAWTDVVYRHTPRSVDSPVLSVLQWQWVELEAIRSDMEELLSRLAPVYNLAAVGMPSGEPDPSSLVTLGNARIKVSDAQSVLGLTADEIARRDPTRLVKRAAILHMDAAIFVNTEGLAYQARPSSPAESGLLVASDGRSKGRVLVNEHWSFGRTLLKSVRPDPAHDEMVKKWYVAAAAALQNRSAFGDLATHLYAAQALFKNDADLLFYNGALHESFSGERIQSVVRDVVLSKSAQLQVEDADGERKRAASFFVQALERNPSLIEARLRLGRVRGLQGRHDEAVRHFELVLASTSDKLVQYYGQLFLGHEEAALGRREEARAAYESAAALYPRAQSPRLSLSLLARGASDRVGAIKLLREIVLGRTTPDDDPWWLYDTTAGRHVNTLLTELCRPFLQGGRR